MARLRGRDALLQMLLAHGVEYIFGNPGTTELPLMDALQDYPQVKYILGLQEATPTFMADGYARATGKPAFVNLHIAAGLANGISALYNAYRGGTPLVLTAGQSDTRMLIQEPVLSGNLVEMCRQFSKWSYEVLHPQDIPTAVRRAFKVAATPPTGPVFLSLPWDTLDREAEVEITPAQTTYFRIRPDKRAVEQAAHMLARAQRPLMLVGDRIAQSGAVAEAVRVAELVGARVHALAFSEVNFPTSHPQYQGSVNLNSTQARDLADQHDVILAVGAPVYAQFLYTEPLLTSKHRLIHLDSNVWDIEKMYPTAVGIWADIREGLVDLADALQQEMPGSAQEAARLRARSLAQEKQARKEAFLKRAKEVWDQKPIAPERLALDLKAVWPRNAILADESITTRAVLNNALDFDEPGCLFGIRGGGLGWGMPGALGVKLAKPDRPVIAVVGDGAAMYTIQALYTAARYNIPVTYVICNNRSYRILKQYLTGYYYPLLGQKRQSQFIGMDLDVDLRKQAEAYGVAGFRVEDPNHLRPTLEKALSLDKPALVDVVIDGGRF
ncbi:MAG: thiamine pyrophosphate-binding protein [Dehalococcoidia bacterium]|nr:thiamine pyrophosphate-binding protein [Dehalococcoidia bacterium]MDW8119082.1 thiamine pyrophosphate-binding protein [Chloroflexota bacterium]